MDVIVLGGAGDMGSRAVRDLARDADVGRLTIADANLERARRLGEELGRDGVEAIRVDADDQASLVAALRDHDAAGGAIGPFYLYEAPIVRAAIAAGVPYASICDDYDAAKAALALGAEARAGGVPVVTGCGWTPGLSNVLARHAADRLDEVETIDVAWGASAADSEGFAVILHTIHIFTGKVPSWRDGGEVEVEAGGGRRRVRFPAPVGEIDVFDLGHPEPVTLPRSMPGVRTVTLKGGLSEAPLNGLARALARLRLTDTPVKKRRVGKVIKAAMPLLGRLGAAGEPSSAIRVDVSGRLGGEPRTVSYGAAGHMGTLTGVPLAIAVRMLARGEIAAPGVSAPEAVIPPERFLGAVAARGVAIVEMAADRPLELGDAAAQEAPAINP
jgi:lysine 6-dehydrogenase